VSCPVISRFESDDAATSSTVRLPLAASSVVKAVTE
jgi:hypothetical protein